MHARLIAPQLIHGENFTPDRNGKQKHEFIYTRTSDETWSVKLGSNTYENIVKKELLNIAAIIGWDLDFVDRVLEMFTDQWIMSLTDKESRHVTQYLKLIHGDIFSLDKKNNKKPKGFG